MLASGLGAVKAADCVGLGRVPVTLPALSVVQALNIADIKLT